MVDMPTAVELIRVYFGLEFATPFILISVLAGLYLFMYLGWEIGHRRGLIEVWANGIPHTQKEYNKIYIKWKHKLDM
jgi:hypothetical protein